MRDDPFLKWMFRLVGTAVIVACLSVAAIIIKLTYFVLFAMRCGS
jgi:hypothetical protein